MSAMACAWDGARMDMLLLLAKREGSVGFDGRGDFFLGDEGLLTRRGSAASAPYVYAGVAIMKPSLFSDTPEGAFSLNLLFDRANRGRPPARPRPRRPVAPCRHARGDRAGRSRLRHGSPRPCLKVHA